MYNKLLYRLFLFVPSVILAVGCTTVPQTSQIDTAQPTYHTPHTQSAHTSLFDTLIAYSDFRNTVPQPNARYDFSGGRHSVAWITATDAQTAHAQFLSQLHNALIGALIARNMAAIARFDTDTHRRDYGFTDNTTRACLPTNSMHDKDNFPCILTVLFEQPQLLPTPAYIGDHNKYRIRFRVVSTVPHTYAFDNAALHDALYARLGHWFIEYQSPTRIRFAGEIITNTK